MSDCLLVGTSPLLCTHTPGSFGLALIGFVCITCTGRPRCPLHNSPVPNRRDNKVEFKTVCHLHAASTALETSTLSRILSVQLFAMAQWFC